MRYILARFFCNNTRKLFILPSEVAYFEGAAPLLIAALRRPISSYTT